MTQIRDKVVVITGTASGLGRALAIEAVKRGAHVAISDVNEAGLAETAALLRHATTKVTTHVIDVRDRAAIERYAREVQAQHGGADILINNAGMAVRAGIEEISYEDFALVVDVCFWGVMYGCKVFLPLLRQRPEGHIVNIASINSMVPFARNGAYNVSKYAVLGLSETLMQELHGGSVQITCVHPGGIKTNIARNGRHYSAEDIATFDAIAMTEPSTAAEVILRGVERNKQRLYVGRDAKIMAIAKRIFPASTVRRFGLLSNNPPPQVAVPNPSSNQP